MSLYNFQMDEDPEELDYGEYKRYDFRKRPSQPPPVKRKIPQKKQKKGTLRLGLETYCAVLLMVCWL